MKLLTCALAITALLSKHIEEAVSTTTIGLLHSFFFALHGRYVRDVLSLGQKTGQLEDRIWHSNGFLEKCKLSQTFGGTIDYKLISQNSSLQQLLLHDLVM